MEHGGRVEEEEQNQRSNAHGRQAHAQSDEHCGRFEGGRLNGSEIVQRSLTNQILTILEQATRSPQAKVARASRGGRIAEPLWLHEHDHIDDGEAQAEHCPENADGSTVARVQVPVLQVHHFTHGPRARTLTRWLTGTEHHGCALVLCWMFTQSKLTRCNMTRFTGSM